MNDLLHPTDTPSLGPCTYVTVHAINPMPIMAWDEETVSSYAFPGWLDHDDFVDAVKPPKDTDADYEGEDHTEYTVDTDDDASMGSEMAPRELVVIRRTSSSNLSLSSYGSNAELLRTHRATTPLLATFLQNRIHTFTSNIEVLRTISTTLGTPYEEEERNHETQIARVNPLARFVLARMHTFTANVEMMGAVFAEQIEASLHLDFAQHAEER